MKRRGAGPLLMDSFAAMADDAPLKIIEQQKKTPAKARETGRKKTAKTPRSTGLRQ